MFDNIIGNDKIKNELINSIKLNKYSHSYLFLGISGIGKKMIAKEFAKMILCESDNKYCNKCKSCIEFDSNNNPDFVILKPDGNNVKIEQIRQLQSKVYEQPIISSRKVYIIDDADCMTIEAQNALLKTLEEPPEFVNIILIGSNESSFLSTIKSRCIVFQFDSIKNTEIIRFLQEKKNLKGSIDNLIIASNGSIGKAIELLDKQDLYLSLDNIINQIENKDLIEILKLSNIIYKSQEYKNSILEYINILLYNKIKENIKYLNCINIVENTKERLKANSNYNMSIDNMLISMWEELH